MSKVTIFTPKKNDCHFLRFFAFDNLHFFTYNRIEQKPYNVFAHKGYKMDNQFFYEKQSDSSNNSTFIHSYGGKCYRHFHQALEIVGVIKGHINVILNGEAHTLYANEIAVIPSFYVHTYDCSEDNEDYVITVSLNMLQEFTKHYSNDFDFFLPKGAYTEQLFATFAMMEKYWQDSNHFMRYGLLNFFFGLLAKAYPPTRKTDTKGFFFANVLRYIDEHIFEDLSLDALAAHFGYSKNYFSSLFNRVMGIHLKDYVNRQRLQKAKARLDRTDRRETVLKIASDCGFNSLNTFYRALRRYSAEPTLSTQEPTPLLDAPFEGTVLNEALNTMNGSAAKKE